VKHELTLSIDFAEPKQTATVAGGAPVKDVPTPDPDAPSIVKRMTTGLLTPERKIRQVPGYARSWINIGKSSWLNLLLVFIPISWALHFAVGDSNPTAVFCTCFVAVIPL
jgi:Ca2+:H+ antiporter